MMKVNLSKTFASRNQSLWVSGFFCSTIIASSSFFSDSAPCKRKINLLLNQVHNQIKWFRQRIKTVILIIVSLLFGPGLLFSNAIIKKVPRFDNFLGYEIRVKSRDFSQIMRFLVGKSRTTGPMHLHFVRMKFRMAALIFLFLIYGILTYPCIVIVENPLCDYHRYR